MPWRARQRCGWTGLPPTSRSPLGLCCCRYPHVSPPAHVSECGSTTSGLIGREGGFTASGSGMTKMSTNSLSSRRRKVLDRMSRGRLTLELTWLGVSQPSRSSSCRPLSTVGWSHTKDTHTAADSTSVRRGDHADRVHSCAADGQAGVGLGDPGKELHRVLCVSKSLCGIPRDSVRCTRTNVALTISERRGDLLGVSTRAHRSVQRSC